jgi:hypothetical protein
LFTEKAVRKHAGRLFANANVEISEILLLAADSLHRFLGVGVARVQLQNPSEFAAGLFLELFVLGVIPFDARENKSLTKPEMCPVVIWIYSNGATEVADRLLFSS